MALAFLLGRLIFGGFFLFNGVNLIMKNIALLGSALMLVAIPQPWPYSVETRRRFAV
jgi:hypothetical protein